MSNPEHQEHSAIKQVEGEHEELRELIGAIHKSLAESPSSAAIVIEQLVTLCEKLEAHFCTEEDGGFFSQITDHAPRLFDQADKLCDEHPIMLEQARAIASKATSGEDSHSWWLELKQAFHEFSKRLMHHESEENELLQKAYWDDIGSND